MSLMPAVHRWLYLKIKAWSTLVTITYTALSPTDDNSTIIRLDHLCGSRLGRTSTSNE
ncbi:hypothetical protein BDZ89DRAFT_1075983 [Hymenopellis radicata]|nr:hypothetical protein BDZ89DRAFT_1075983 [Hymenopellis radicata]